MDVGSGNDNTVDSFVSPDDAVDLDLPVTPRSTEVPIFQSKIKEKAKVTDSSHDPELEADTIAGSKPSTALSGAGLCSDENEQDVDRGDVVREISVFCGSGNFGEELYVVQHVLRGAGRPYELNKRCEEVRWKPKQQKMEVDLRMERDHENYDHERSEPLNLKKQTLSSTTMASSRIQYAIGFLEKNKFHLNPVNAILQLRPSFASPLDDLPKEEMVSETAEASSNPIEPWVVLQYHPIDSSLSYKIKQKMAAEVVRNEQFMLTRSDYLHSLPSRKLADETVARAPSMRVLHRKPLEERLQQKSGKKFSMMMGSQASDSVETETEHNADSSFNRDGEVIESLAEQSMSIETHEHIRRALLEIFNYKTVLRLCMSYA